MSSKINNFLITSVFYIYMIGGAAAVILSYFFHFNKEYIGYCLFFGGLFSFLLIRARFQIRDQIARTNAISRFQVLSFFCVAGLSMAAILIMLDSRQYYSLPLSFFLLIFLSCLIISLQIIYVERLSNRDVNLILLEILGFSFVIGLCFVFLFPGVYGNDATYHTEYIDSITASHRIDNYVGHYQNYPIYQLIHVATDLVLNISNIKFTEAIISGIQVILLAPLFLIVKRLINERVALFSLLIIAFAPHLIQSRFWIFPYITSAVFVVLLLYCMFFLEKGFNSSLLVVFLFAFVNFTHPLTPIMLLATVILIYIINKLFRLKALHISITMMAAFFMLIAMRIVWQIGTGYNLLQDFVLYINDIFQYMNPTGVGRITLAGSYSWESILLSDLGFTLMLFFGTLGAFYLLKRSYDRLANRPEEGRNVYLPLISLGLSPIPFILAMLAPITLPDRWFSFIEIFLSIYAGFGIFMVYRFLSRSKVRIVIPVIAAAMIFLTVASPVVNPNGQIFSNELSTRSALEQPEASAVAYIQSLNVTKIYGNTRFIGYVNRTFYDFYTIDPSNPNTYKNQLMVIRVDDLKYGFYFPLYGAGGKFIDIIYPNATFYAYLNSSNVLYRNDLVTIYR
ncbi:MAG: glycosyltransferase family 39 protein [Candidatus Methanomethylicus sp.]|nr:glycosyltransferase family 39 protein [Candidatus Methanomethylicus sp.]